MKKKNENFLAVKLILEGSTPDMNYHKSGGRKIKPFQAPHQMLHLQQQLSKGYEAPEELFEGLLSALIRRKQLSQTSKLH